VLHDLAVLDVLARHHGVQHLLLLCYPPLHAVRLREQLVERERIQQALLTDLGHLHQLLVPETHENRDGCLKGTVT